MTRKFTKMEKHIWTVRTLKKHPLKSGHTYPKRNRIKTFLQSVHWN